MIDRILTAEEVGMQKKYADYVRNYNLECKEKNGRDNSAFVLTFGCQQNEADSERLLGMALDMGYVKADSPENADLILVNTCAVREHAEQRTLSIVGGYKHLKVKNPDLLIGMCGCMVSQEHRKSEIRQKFHQVDFVLGTSSLYRFPETLAQRISSGKRAYCPEDEVAKVAEGLPIERASSYRAWVSIMYGCNNFCSYCIVPFVRGRERSRRPEDVIAEVRALIENGYRDITLLGQNVNSYAKGTGYDFADLLAELDKIPGDYTLRFMSSHPKDADKKLIDVMADSRHVERHFHLPMQSGNDRLLKVMNRRYDMEKYLGIVDYIREKMPDAAITSDIIVGFPGETEEEFNDTIDALQKIKFDSIYGFIYSPRTGTTAAEMEQVPDDVKSRRFQYMMDVQNGIALEKNLADVGKTVRVLCDGVSKTSNLFSGRTDGNKIVFFEGGGYSAGQFLNVRIDRAEAYAFYGTVEK